MITIYQNLRSREHLVYSESTSFIESHRLHRYLDCVTVHIADFLLSTIISHHRFAQNDHIQPLLQLIRIYPNISSSMTPAHPSQNTNISISIPPFPQRPHNTAPHSPTSTSSPPFSIPINTPPAPSLPYSSTTNRSLFPVPSHTHPTPTHTPQSPSPFHPITSPPHQPLSPN